MKEGNTQNLDLLLEKIDLGDPSGSTCEPLNETLKASAAEREAWIDHCLVETMLESDDLLAAEVAADVLPENVVALPGQPRRRIAKQADIPKATGKKSVVKPLLAVAALLISMALIAAYVLNSGGNSSTDSLAEENSATPTSVRPAPGIVSHVDAKEGHRGEAPAKPVDREKDAPVDSRISEYERMLLAGAPEGSLNRPPTPSTLVAAVGNSGGPAQRVSFNRDIRPILSDNCVECHGPDAAAREADLRLDQEEDAVVEFAAFEAGESEAPIVRGHPELSALIARIETDDRDDLMPPPDSHKVLTIQQIELLKRWVLEGAEWEQHWAFVVPSIDVDERSEPSINGFVEDRLKAEGLSPAQRADRRTLIRRVSLDLTGLPPTPEDVAAFAADESGDDAAFEKVIDRLLASKAYGEHRARYWLDAARYADTHGLHLDNYREMWPYRDWVIKAYNRNLPFDQFTIAQLAGDLLENPTQDQLVATGFNRCNVTTSEGGAIKEEFAVRYAIDRVSTTSTVWMGLTTGCAQCHDHKYDPISMREFYQLFAYFNNTTQAAMDGNVPNTPPVIRVYPDDEAKAKENELKEQIKATDKALADARNAAEGEFQEWLKVAAAVEVPAAGSDSALPGQVDTSEFLVREGEPFTLMARIAVSVEAKGYLPILSQIDADGRGMRFGIDVSNFGSELALNGRGGESGEGGALKVRQINSVKPGSNLMMTVICDGTRDPKGITVFNGEREMTRNRYPYLEHDDLRDSFSVAAGTPLKVLAGEALLKELKLFRRALTLDEIKLINQQGKVIAAAKKAADKRSKDEIEVLRKHFLATQINSYRDALERRAEVELLIEDFEARVPITHVMNEKTDAAPMANILERGEYDKKLEEVAPGVPAALPPLPESAQSNRLGLARWLVSGEHPLTARVTVNRLWQQIFGIGLVKTAGDFGSQGEPPSHPELLDWLAADFVANGWDVKRTLKQMVMSPTYRQSSRVTPELLAADPENRLLARGPRFRLDGEVIRDQALAASGLLSDEIGGPGVKPYQPGGLWSAVGYSNSNTVKFARHHGDRLYRRSIYTFWKRTAPPPNMTAFDAPDRESCTISRERTNTPLQALVLMNDVQFLEAARHLAERGLESGGGERALDTMSLRLLGRSLDSAEMAIVGESLAAFRKTYGNDATAANALLHHGDKPNDSSHPVGELAALTMVASQLLNLDEAITKN